MSLTMDYFYDKRTDVLGERATTVPGMFGITLPIENLTKIDNKGIELTLGYKDGVGQDFSYSLNANMTYTRNKVVFFDEPEDLNPNLRQTGRPIGMTYGYKALGLFQTQEEVDNWATQKGNNAPGDVKMQMIGYPSAWSVTAPVFPGSSTVLVVSSSIRTLNFHSCFKVPRKLTITPVAKAISHFRENRLS
jgi:hypothetical protein